MKIQYIGHAGLLVKEEDVTIAFDPFLSGSFYWRGKLNTYLGDSPWIGTEEKMKAFVEEFASDLTAILISHAHMDHFDPPAIVKLLEKNPEIQFFAPYPVINWLKSCDIANSRITKFLAPVEWNGSYNIEAQKSDVDVDVMPNSGIKKERLASRVGYLIKSRDGKGLFLTGDSRVGNEWGEKKKLVTHIATWGKAVKKGIVEYFHVNGRLKKVWLIHWEDFCPGNFDCSDDPREFIDIVESQGIDAEVLPYKQWIEV